MPNYDALRLVFEREGGEIRLLESIPLDMVVPDGDPLEDGSELAGFFVCLYDDGGSLLYRRALASPLFDEAEVFTGEEDRPFVRVPLPEAKVQFDVVVPNPRARAEVELLASPPVPAESADSIEQESRDLRARPVARFAIDGGEPAS